MPYFQKLFRTAVKSYSISCRVEAVWAKTDRLRLGTPIPIEFACFMIDASISSGKTYFYYVYILRSESDQNRFYVGFTRNLRTRLKEHNSGKNPHTAKSRPWRIKTAIAFDNRQKALDFERYLKSPSGRAFAKKRL